MVQVGGLATGLDVNGIVTQLVGAEITPAQFRIDQREAAFQADISALGTLRSALNEFRTAVTDLEALTELQARSTSNSNGELFSVSADADAAPGRYDVQVIQLAEAQRLISGGFASPSSAVGTGTLTITQGTDSFSLSVTSPQNTLEDISTAINAASDNPGVQAAIVNVDDGSGGTESRLVLTAGAVGSADAIAVSVVDDDGDAADASGLSTLAYPPGGTGEVMVEDQAGQNALIRIFGRDVTRSSNTISDAISGVTLTLT
ncbi:MAG: flagellar filament capping protein FliD, partial [Myxococcota bacterium]